MVLFSFPILQFWGTIYGRPIAVFWLITLLIVVNLMGNSQSISSLSYGILEQFDTKTFKQHAKDTYAKSYLI